MWTQTDFERAQTRRHWVARNHLRYARSEQGVHGYEEADRVIDAAKCWVPTCNDYNSPEWCHVNWSLASST